MTSSDKKIPKIPTWVAVTLEVLARQGSQRPRELALLLWWMDQEIWKEMGEGLTFQAHWVATVGGPTLDVAVPLLSDQIPAPWGHWLVLDHGQVRASDLARTLDHCGELSPRMHHTIRAALKAGTSAFRIARDRAFDGLHPTMDGHCSAESVLRWTGWSPTDVAHLAQDHAERLAFYRAFHG
jgi:hypothetical protein